MSRALNATPAPWGVGYRDANSQVVVMSDHIEICTCWHHSVESIEREAEANAHLIAAAPDLYYALQSTLTLLRAFVNPESDDIARAVVELATAALAKARDER